MEKGNNKINNSMASKEEISNMEEGRDIQINIRIEIQS